MALTTSAPASHMWYIQAMRIADVDSMLTTSVADQLDLALLGQHGSVWQLLQSSLVSYTRSLPACGSLSRCNSGTHVPRLTLKMCFRACGTRPGADGVPCRPQPTHPRYRQGGYPGSSASHGPFMPAELCKLCVTNCGTSRLAARARCLQVVCNSNSCCQGMHQVRRLLFAASPAPPFCIFPRTMQVKVLPAEVTP